MPANEPTTDRAATGTMRSAQSTAAGAPSTNGRGPEADTILRVEGLKMHFPITDGIILQREVGKVRAVDGLDFTVKRGETLGLVGESGCGKSTTGRAILQLYRPTAGHVFFEGQDLTKMNGEQLRQQRRQMQMIFQDPYASLNPRLTVGSIIGEPLQVHGMAKGKDRQERVQELLRVVGLNAYYVNRYPHEFSGGQRQRIGIARALAVNPRFIVADEPISALDVTIRAQVINLMEDLLGEFNLTFLLIAHDLSVVRHISDRVAVMYLGKIVELADRQDLYQNPLHPYTKALLSAVPIPDPIAESKRERIILQGDVPSPINPPSGCRFHTRCPIAIAACSEIDPPFEEKAPGHWAACIRV
jgi:oligopeptide transport system ATP-binding protein